MSQSERLYLKQQIDALYTRLGRREDYRGPNMTVVPWTPVVTAARIFDHVLGAVCTLSRVETYCRLQADMQAAQDVLPGSEWTYFVKARKALNEPQEPPIEVAIKIPLDSYSLFTSTEFSGQNVLSGPATWDFWAGMDVVTRHVDIIREVPSEWSLFWQAVKDTLPGMPKMPDIGGALETMFWITAGLFGLSILMNRRK